MNKSIETGAGLAIVLVVAGTMAFLTLKFSDQFGSLSRWGCLSSWYTHSSTVKQISPTVTPPVQISAQVNPGPTTDFLRSKYQLSFKYPATFYRQKEIDGTFAYTAYFTSKDIKNDYRQLGNGDVQLSVVVNKKGNTIEEDNLKELEQLGVVKIENIKTITIDGVSAVQSLLNVLKEDPGCDLRTDFTKGKVSYRISLFSLGGSCETVRRFMPEYEGILQNFHVGK